MNERLNIEALCGNRMRIFSPASYVWSLEANRYNGCTGMAVAVRSTSFFSLK
jgi:hypothetical protein